MLPPIKVQHYIGDRVPLGFVDAWLLSEPIILDGWTLLGNPNHAENRVWVELRICHGEERVTEAQPILQARLHLVRAQYPTNPDDLPLGIALPSGTFLGLWVLESSTDYFLFQPHTRPQIVQFQPPQRIPLPGEGETVG